MRNNTSIWNSKDFELWLDGRDRFVAAALANRIAMRVLPFALPRGASGIGTALDRRLIGVIWRATAVSRLMIMNSDKAKEIVPGLTAAHAAIVVAYIAVDRADRATHPSRFKSIAAAARLGRARRAARTYAAAAAAAVVGDNSFVNTADAAFAAFAAAQEDEDVLGETISSDCRWWDGAARTPAELFARPLWPDGIPCPFTGHWAAFRRAAATSDDWSEWIAWYDRKLRGHPTEWGLSAAGEAEMARRLVALTDEEWKAAETEPATINLKLRQWLAELSDPVLPQQDPSTITYGTDETGRLVRLPTPPEHRLLDTPTQRDAYEELRRAAADMVSDHGQRLGLGLHRILAAIAALPEDLADANRIAVWRLIVRSNGALAKHMGAAPPPEFDADRLEHACAVDLQYLVASANLLAMGDSGLSELNGLQVPLQIMPDLRREAAAAAPLVAALTAEPDLSAPEVRDDMAANEQAIAEARENPVDAALVQDAVKGQRNIFGAAICAAYRWAQQKAVAAAKPLSEGALKAAGEQLTKHVWANWDRYVVYGQMAFGKLTQIDWAQIAEVIGRVLP